MSNIEINDFSPRFDDDFREDVGYMADNINRILSELARRYGGALDELDRYFSDHRNNFLELFETIIATEVLERRQPQDGVLSDANLGSLAICAKTIRGGNRNSDEWINGELENNPFFREAARSSRRDERRDERYSSRDLDDRRGNYRDRPSRENYRDRDRGRDDRYSSRDRDRGGRDERYSSRDREERPNYGGQFWEQSDHPRRY